MNIIKLRRVLRIVIDNGAALLRIQKKKYFVIFVAVVIYLKFHKFKIL